MLLSLLKLNIVVNIEGKNWFGQLIYETHGVKKSGGSWFHEAMIRSMALGRTIRALWHRTKTLHVWPGEVKICGNCLDKSGQKIPFPVNTRKQRWISPTLVFWLKKIIPLIQRCCDCCISSEVSDLGQSALL